MHVAEPGYGVAIANDSTYGYDVDRTARPDGGTTTTRAVLAAPRPRGSPIPRPTRAPTCCASAIQPGASIGDAVALGYDLRNPLRPVRAAAPLAPIVTSSDPAVVIETVKLAEDGSGDLVVRLYESRGGRATTTLAFDGTAATDRAAPTSSSGRCPARRPREGSSIELPFRPFQLRTVRFRGATAR